MDTQDMMILCTKDKGCIYECDTLRQELATVASERDDLQWLVTSDKQDVKELKDKLAASEARVKELEFVEVTCTNLVNELHEKQRELTAYKEALHVAKSALEKINMEGFIAAECEGVLYAAQAKIEELVK